MNKRLEEIREMLKDSVGTTFKGLIVTETQAFKELNWCVSEIDRLTKENEKIKIIQELGTEKNYKLKEKLRIAQEALEFYAEGRHVEVISSIMHGSTQFHLTDVGKILDDGKKARETLEKIK